MNLVDSKVRIGVTEPENFKFEVDNIAQIP